MRTGRFNSQKPENKDQGRGKAKTTSSDKRSFDEKPSGDRRNPRAGAKDGASSKENTNRYTKTGSKDSSRFEGKKEGGRFNPNDRKAFTKTSSSDRRPNTGGPREGKLNNERNKNPHRETGRTDESKERSRFIGADRKTYGNDNASGERKSTTRHTGDGRFGRTNDSGVKRTPRSNDDSSQEKSFRPSDKKTFGDADGERKTRRGGSKGSGADHTSGDRVPDFSRFKGNAKDSGARFKKKTSESPSNENKQAHEDEFDEELEFAREYVEKTKKKPKAPKESTKEGMRLNRFVANAGVCSRRDADKLIENGEITINDKIVTTMGYTVLENDVVKYKGNALNAEKKIYLLLNKPKDVVTTNDDPHAEFTVMDIVKNACEERIYPVGRLDKQTTGLLLFTNDGDLAKKLTHPQYNAKKIYHVFTDKPITAKDLEQLASGVTLEDGPIHVDAISYVDMADKCQAGVEIHSGRNRIVRRMFEHLGYKVMKLDRVFFAGLTKVNIPRGKYRFLTPKEVTRLKGGFWQ